LFEPKDIKNGSGKAFKVFTPFWKHCLRLSDAIEAPLPEPEEMRSFSQVVDSDSLKSLSLLPSVSWDVGLSECWQIGEESVLSQLRQFIHIHLADYTTGRDYPARKGTSLLSPYLHFGMISPRIIWFEVKGFVENVAPENADAAGKFLAELGWREFCAHLLFHFPFMQTRPFKKEFSDFHWQNNPMFLRAWQEGKTGYPLVDAGMRQLWKTGIMHNRVRMVVASFLTKHLRLHWLEGEAWFWDTLVDADYASNIAS
jgi:deoxyribodipyrimidine photo-lyase